MEQNAGFFFFFLKRAFAHFLQALHPMHNQQEKKNIKLNFLIQSNEKDWEKEITWIKPNLGHLNFVQKRFMEWGC